MPDEVGEWPTKCPSCGSKEFTHESQSEYTGGGYADYWDEFECRKCGKIWRSEEKTSYS